MLEKYSVHRCDYHAILALPHIPQNANAFSENLQEKLQKARPCSN